MASEKLAKLVEDLSQRIEDARDELQPSEQNEPWTKTSVIMPLLEGLGWDKGKDVSYENSPDDVEGSLDFILKCDPPIGIEAKALHVPPPRDRNHPHITKGLRQSKERGASYFIWTNGDCWQFYSLALENAPIYPVTLSSVRSEAVPVNSIADKLRIIEKERFTAYPKIFDGAICDYWKTTALPDAWREILEKNMDELLQLIRKGLPTELDIKDEEISEFLRTLKHYDVGTESSRLGPKKPEIIRKYPDEYEQLLASDLPNYDMARRRFRRDLYRKLGEYLISEKYKPWAKSRTWKLVDISDNKPHEKKKVGPVIGLFMEWRFIEKAEGRDMYKRVEDGVEYLKKLLE